MTNFDKTGQNMNCKAPCNGLMLARKLLVLYAIFGPAGCATSDSSRTIIASQVMVGEQFLRNAEYGRGYNVLDTVAGENPTSSIAALSLGDAYYRQSAYMKAAAFYARAVELDADIEGKLGLARVELARSNPDAARAYLQDILTREPNNLHALNGLAVAHELSSQPGLAQQVYRKILAIDPSNKNAHNNLALSEALNGQSRLALPRIAELLRSNLNDKTIRQNLAIIEYLSNNRDSAMRAALVDLTDVEARQNFRSLDRYRRGAER